MQKAVFCIFAPIAAALLSGVCLAGRLPMKLERQGVTEHLVESGKPESEPDAPRPIAPIKAPGHLNLFPVNAHELNTKKIEALDTATERVYIMDISLRRGVEEDENRLLQTVNMALERKVDVKILVKRLESKQEMRLYREGVIKFLPPLRDGLAEYDGEMVIVRDSKELLESRGWLYKRIKTSTWRIDIREIEELFRKAWQ